MGKILMEKEMRKIKVMEANKTQLNKAKATLESLSKAEAKRLRQMAASGAGARLAQELRIAKREVAAVRIRMAKNRIKYAGIGGSAFKTPAVLKTALQKALAAKNVANEAVVKLKKKQNGPMALEMKSNEQKAKGQYASIQASVNGAKKQLKADKAVMKK